MRFLILFFSFSLFADPIGEWVETDPPQEVEMDLVVETPLVGVDANCNAVSVWLAKEGSQSVRMDGAKLAFGSDIWISTSTISGENTRIGDLHLEVAPCGDAVVVFVKEMADTTMGDVCGARLSAGETTWILTTPSPLNQNISGMLTLSMNDSGDAIVAWMEGESRIRAARLASGSTNWVLTQDVVTTNINMLPKVSLNNCGDAVIVWGDVTTAVLRGARLRAGKQNWEPTGNIPAGSGLLPTGNLDLALDDSGRAILVFTVQNMLFETFIRGAKLPARTFGWISTGNLSSGPLDNFPQVRVGGPLCRAVAIWEDQENGIIQGAVLPFDDNLWISTNDLSSGLVQAYDAELAMDDFGNTVAVWNAGNMAIEGAVLNAYSQTWIPTNDLNTTDGKLTVFDPDVAVSPNGQLAVGVWGVVSDRVGVGVSAATNCMPFAPAPVGNLFAEQIPNRFSSQKEYFNRIFWTASPSLDVAFYKILRNGEEVGVLFPVGGLVFEDHNQRKGSENVYTVIAVSLNGMESFPKTIKVNK